MTEITTYGLTSITTSWATSFSHLEPLTLRNTSSSTCTDSFAFHDETVVLCYGQEGNQTNHHQKKHSNQNLDESAISISSNASGTETHFGIPEKKKKHFLQEILHLWLFFPCTSGHKSLICQLISAISQSP